MAVNSAARAHKEKVSFAIELLRSRLARARLSGYIDRVRETERSGVTVEDPKASGLTADELLNMSEDEFSDVLDKLSSDELREAMENSSDD